jgi:hypothetical protein
MIAVGTLTGKVAIVTGAVRRSGVRSRSSMPTTRKTTP